MSNNDFITWADIQLDTWINLITFFNIAQFIDLKDWWIKIITTDLNEWFDINYWFTVYDKDKGEL